MNPGLLHPKAHGRDPFEEVWFIEATLDAERAVWLRYGHARVAGQDRWTVQAMVLRGSEQWMHAEAYPSRPATDASIHPAGLDPTRAVGRAGDLSWDLELSATVAHHHVPKRLSRLKLTGREYASPALDLRINGSIEVGGETWTFTEGVGVLGHIWGHRANTRQWVWCHASGFDDHPDVQVEILCARLGLGPVTLPWASSIVVQHGVSRWALTKTRTLFAPTIRLQPDGWSLQAKHRDVAVRLHALLPHAGSTFTLDVEHANGRSHRVKNSPIGTLRLELDHPEWGRLAMHTDRASVEIARPHP